MGRTMRKKDDQKGDGLNCTHVFLFKDFIFYTIGSARCQPCRIRGVEIAHDPNFRSISNFRGFADPRDFPPCQKG